MIGLGAALLGSAGASAGSSILSTVLNAKFAQGENELDRLNAEHLTRLQQNNALQQMRIADKYNRDYMQIQQDYEREMSNTAYQRAVADMEAAGLNPASLMGSSVSAASTPSSGLAHANAAGAGVGSGSHGSNRLGANLDFGSSAFNTAIHYMLAHDKDASKYVAKSIVNSAIHENAMDKAAKVAEGKTVADYMKEQGVNDWMDLDFDKIKIK